MKNNVENALQHLRDQGCNMSSNVINYELIAEYLVSYSNRCGNEIDLNIQAKPVVFDNKEFKELRKKSGLTMRDVELATGL